MERLPPKWIWPTALLLLPVMYLGSFIPIVWALKHNILPMDVWRDRIGPTYVVPLEYSVNHSPPVVREWIGEYILFLERM